MTSAAADKPVVEIPDGPPPTELVLEDLTVGDGPEAVAGKTCTMQYVGVSWSTGRQFDASWDRGEPFTFGLGQGQVIRGWDQGVGEGLVEVDRLRCRRAGRWWAGRRGAGGGGRVRARRPVVVRRAGSQQQGDAEQGRAEQGRGTAAHGETSGS